MRLHGQDAIDHATATGGTVNIYTTPIQEAREDVAVDDEQIDEIMLADEGLIYVDAGETDDERAAYRAMGACE